MQIAVDALPANSDNSKTLLFTVQDSANDSAFADVNPLVQLQVLGVTTNGSAATSVNVRPPPTIRRYVRLSHVLPSGSGANTALKASLKLVF